MGIWLSERKTAGLWAGGLWRSQQGSPYAFNLDLSTFKDTVTGQSLSCNIDGTRYDEVDGVTTAFTTDVPTICDKGMRICGAYSNMLSYSSELSNAYWAKENVTVIDSKTIAAKTAASTRIYREGGQLISANATVSVRLFIESSIFSQQFSLNIRFTGSGQPVENNVVNFTPTVGQHTFTKTATNPLCNVVSALFYLNPNHFYGTAVINDTITYKIGQFSKKYAFPYIPTTSAAVSSPSEAGNSGTGTGIWIDDVATKHPLLYSALQSAGTMTLKWKPGYSSADVTGKLNILSFDGVTKTLDYDADSQLMRFTDGTITLVSALTVVADTVYNIKVSWGNGTMQLSVDDSVPCQGVFSGFTVSDIYFGLGNEELQYISEFKVLKAEDKSLTTNTREFFFDVIATQTVAGVFRTTSGQTITVYWGDGSSNTYTGTTDQAYSKDYGSAGNRTVTIANKSALTNFTMTTTGANIRCDVADLPVNLTYVIIQGSNTISGDVADLPVNLTYVIIQGSNTISDYTERTWANNQRRIYFIPVSPGGLSSAEVDQLLIDLANVTTWTTDKIVYLKGTNAARTSASDAAVATLQSKGVTVTTN